RTNTSQWLSARRTSNVTRILPAARKRRQCRTPDSCICIMGAKEGASSKHLGMQGESIILA
ncbi:hypothetical protein M441DRAFT_115050, partial [Trichoderma asperellum CBS 433.97]